MTRVYVDTSVLAAYYCPEALSAAAEAALTSAGIPAISALSELELFSVIAKKRRAGNFSARKAENIMAMVNSHLADGYYHKVTVETGHYHTARDLIAQSKHNLHTLDALHLAVALAHNLALLTADRAMAAAAKSLGVEVKKIGA